MGMVSFEEHPSIYIKGLRKILRNIARILIRISSVYLPNAALESYYYAVFLCYIFLRKVAYAHVLFLLICANNFSTKDFFSPFAASVEFVIVTTNLINGNTFLKSLMEPLGPDLPPPRQ